MNSGKVILVSATTSSGKSTIAKLICDLNLNFVKLNTKLMSDITHEQFSVKYFQEEMQKISDILHEPIKTIRDVLLIAKTSKDPAFQAIFAQIEKKAAELDQLFYLKILYSNYLKETKKILNNGHNCVIDHNIFIDPYPAKKEMFLNLFSSFGNKFKVLNLYNTIERCILNTLDRNKRFTDFICLYETGKLAEKALEKNDIDKGFSFSIFRQPLRILENWFSMYNIEKASNQNPLALQTIDQYDYQNLILISQHEQDQLIGLLILKDYPFTHIPNEELTEFRSKFTYLKQLVHCKRLYVLRKRFQFDYQILNVHSIFKNNNEKQLYKLLSDWPNEKQVIQLNDHNSTTYKNKLKTLVKKIRLQKNYTFQNFSTIKNRIRKEYNFTIYKVDNFLKEENLLNVISTLASNTLANIEKKLVIFPITKNQYSCILITNKSQQQIEIEFICPDNSINIESYDNNLIFIARFYSALTNLSKTNLQLKISKFVNPYIF